MCFNYDCSPDALTVSAGSARLVGNSIWGVLWGLETFSQLVYEVGRGNVSCQPLGYYVYQAASDPLGFY